MNYSSIAVKIGNIYVGGNYPVVVQSMTTTNTRDTISTVNQVCDLANAGCDIVRITTPNILAAENLINIKQQLKKRGITIPIIADVHFNPKVAEVAARIVEKVRINSGNYVDNAVTSDASKINYGDAISKIEEKLLPLLKICKQHNTAIRIGVNHGSLSGRMLYKYGNTALGMVKSIIEFVEVCNKNDFHKLILSLKASNVKTMIEANIMLVNVLKQKGFAYPIHLGVTEAGSDDEGRVKSAAGIGYLLSQGIGDTIRVSLAENPTFEIPVAKNLVSNYGRKAFDNTNLVIKKINKSKNKTKSPLVITKHKSRVADFSFDEIIENEVVRNSDYSNIAVLNYDKLPYDELMIRATVDALNVFYSMDVDGICIDNDMPKSSDELAKLAFSILQVIGLRITTTEFIACPTCGRTSMDIISLLKEVKLKTAHLPGIKIAVMGCNVNGPGEMADAHYGFVGTPSGKVNIYKEKNIIHKNIHKDIAIESLVALMAANGDWVDK